MKTLLLFSTGILLLPQLTFAQMKMDFIIGEVKVQPRGGKPVAAARGQNVATGDIVETGKGSTAVITYAGNKITVRQNTRVQMAENIEAGKKYGAVALLSGSVNCKMDRLKKDKGRFDINTPATVAAVRGTEFDAASGADGSALIQVSEGSVEVTGIQSSVMVAANQESSVPMGGDPSPVRILKKRDWAAWAADASQSPAGREREILTGCLSRVQKLDGDIAQLEGEREKRKQEKEEFQRLYREARESGDKAAANEYGKKMSDAQRGEYTSNLKAGYQAEKIILVKSVAQNVFEQAADKEALENLMKSIEDLYQKHYLRYIKPIEDEVELKRKIQERRRKK